MKKPPLNLGNIPPRLEFTPQWVAWRSDKTPINPKSGANAKANVPETWGTYREAVRYVNENGDDSSVIGIGFQFSSNDPFAGVDLDKCRDLETGKIEPRAWEIINRLDSYTEISPSGTGVHILVEAQVPPGGNKKGSVEMYSQGRYFTVTGDHLEGTPTTIQNRQTELEALHKEIFGQEKEEVSQKPDPPVTSDLTDSELIEKATQATNGEKFAKLWRGDWSDYPSQSEATAALLGILVFWAGPDLERIDRIFRISGLMRDKWDRPQSGSTWGAIEIENAIANANDFYSGSTPLETMTPTPVRDKKDAKKEKTKNKRLTLKDLQQGRFLHSAIDFQNGIMVLGFRVELPDGETGIAVITSNGKTINSFVNRQEVEIDGLIYMIKKGGVPPLLEDVWDLNNLKDFLKAPFIVRNLYQNILNTLRDFIDLPEPSYGLMAAWAVGTYFAHIFSAFPFLHFYGPKETGKSKSLEALRFLCFNAWKGRDISVAALGDTVDGMRGTMLIDQAENLPENLVGILADSYKKAGGRRRVMDMSNKRRTVLEFSTYGPKAFASTKDLDPDLKDRCIRVPMVRTKKPLPDLEGNEPIWATLRDALYRFLLTNFRRVEENYMAIPGDGTRITELWRPMLAVLQTLEVDEEEIETIRQVFTEGTQETRSEPTGWELALLEALKDRATASDGQRFVMSPQEIISAMEFEGDDKPGPKWIGDTLSRYRLYIDKKRVQDQRKKRTDYIFDSGRVLELCKRYLRETSANDVSLMSADNIINDLD